MSKNKFNWIIAMILIAVFMIPAANAQILGGITGRLAGINWYYLLINAAVIFFVLFLLQAVLVPNKEGKEKTSMWIIMLIVAMLIAWLYGGAGYIWKTGFIGQFFATYTWYVVLVNTIIICAVLYFVFGLLKINEKLGGNKEGQIGYTILLLIISAALAIKVGENNWIWSTPTISTLISYFFGRYGILTTNENRIFIFIGTSVLFAVFFDYVGLGKENRKLNYMLAIIFAANLVSGPDPYTYKDIKPMVLIIGTWILGGNLSEKFTGKWKIAGYAIAFLLMLWAVTSVETAVTPDGKAAVATSGGGVTGWIFGFFKILLSSKGIIILGVIVLFLFFVIFRGENRRRALTLAWGEIKKRLNAISGSAKYKRETPFGREPQFFRENRLLFHAIANWTTRSEITYRYWAVVKDAGKMWLKVKDDISEFTDMEKLRKELITFRSGGKYQDQQIEGWNKLNLQVADLLNRYYKLLARIQLSAAYKLKEPDPTLWGIETDEMTSLQTEAVNLTNKIKSDYERYNDRIKAYGAHYVLKAYKDIILHMSNVVGEVLEHPQKFARPGAEYDMGNQNPLVKSNIAGKNAEGLPTDEVNQFGEVVADIVEQKDSFGGLSPDPRDYKKPRKLVHASDIIDYPKFVEFIDNIEKDWKGLAEDIRYGLHHPKSRTVKSYLDALRGGKYYEWADLDIKQINSPSISDWALDMRALADPGKNVYWGRKHFFSETIPINSENLPPDNPLPILSSLGLKQFLIEASIKDGMDRAKITEFLNKYHADSAAPEKELPHYPIGVMLGEEAAKAEHGS